MPKYLMINGTTDTIRLPADTDLAQLKNSIETASNQKRTAWIVGEMGDDPLSNFDIAFNPSQVTWWSVVETRDPGVW